MDEMEGVYAATMDELLDPKISNKTGKPYWQISVRKTGQGVGELFVTEQLYNKLKALGVKMGAELILHYKLRKIGGSFETRLEDVVVV